MKIRRVAKYCNTPSEYLPPPFRYTEKKQEDTLTHTFLLPLVGEAGLEPARPQ